MTNRRQVLLGGLAAAGAASLSGCNWGRTIPELRWLGWEHYDVRDLREEFEETYKCRVNAQYFDGNSEAWAKLKSGKPDDYHLVMADGFWPRLYAKEGLTVPVDTNRVENLVSVFDDFKAPNYQLLQSGEATDETIAFPNCWGGYGLTVNKTKLKALGIEEFDSLELLFDPRLKGLISTSARFEENIALAGILACTQLGTISGPRPDGKPFNPYVLTNAELERCKELLVRQQELLRTRWNDEDTLERLLRSQEVLVSPEWSGIYRRIQFEKWNGTSDLNMDHILRPKEGGLGWVDTWCMTRGAAQDPTIENLAYAWVNFRLEKSSMMVIAKDVGWAPCVDITEELKREDDGDKYIQTLFLDKTADIGGLYQFDMPSDTEAWERLWSQVLAS